MSQVSTLLLEIATELGKPKESVQPFIKTLEENWYDSLNSLKQITDQEYERMRIPIRIAQMIKQKLGIFVAPNLSYSTPPKSNVIVLSSSPASPAREVITISPELEAKVIQALKDLKSQTFTNQNLIDSLFTLDKLFANIIKNPDNEQFRHIRISNEKFFNTLAKYAAGLQILYLVGFEQFNDMVVLPKQKLNLKTVQDIACIVRNFGKQIEHQLEKNPFNPYIASFIQQTILTPSPNKGEEDQNEINNFTRKLQQLQAYRESLIRPIYNREIKAIRLREQSGLGHNFLTSSQQDYSSQDIIMYRTEIQKMIKEVEENQQFSSKRKKEFEQELKKPFFTETTIRIKFPNNQMFEAKFTPRETIQDIKNILQPYLADPNWNYYLFQSPPVQKFEGKLLMANLDQLNCIPNATIFFSFYDKNFERYAFEYLSPLLRQYEIIL